MNQCSETRLWSRDSEADQLIGRMRAASDVMFDYVNTVPLSQRTAQKSQLAIPEQSDRAPLSAASIPRVLLIFAVAFGRTYVVVEATGFAGNATSQSLEPRPYPCAGPRGSIAPFSASTFFGA